MSRRPRERNISFVPMANERLGLVAGWLRQPHNREWWGDPDEEVALISAMLDGCDTTRPFIFEINGEPVGYIQYWFVGHHQNRPWIDSHPWLTELPNDAIGVDLSIGNAAYLSKGIGSAVLQEFTERLSDDGHRTIIIDPDPDNVRAVRAYEKAGFRVLERLRGRSGDDLIMQYQRAEECRAL